MTSGHPNLEAFIVSAPVQPRANLRENSNINRGIFRGQVRAFSERNMAARKNTIAHDQTMVCVPQQGAG
jgi:hypothetical protein